VTSDPHVLGPGLAPTPFTAAEIRAGCPAGRVVHLLVEDVGEAPYVRYNRFTSCDADGATIERGRVDGAPGPADRTTWADLQAHAAFPAAGTTIAPDTIELPLGVLACDRYTVRDDEGVYTFWFAGEYPGMPVRITREVDGRTVATTTMIASETGGAR
jgi:hypothetical protein